eukprot:scaffold1306_cov182-Pinguiococcus_pyrenoidosus.AAC.1
MAPVFCTSPLRRAVKKGLTRALSTKDDISAAYLKRKTGQKRLFERFWRQTAVFSISLSVLLLREEYGNLSDYENPTQKSRSNESAQKNAEPILRFTALLG